MMAGNLGAWAADHFGVVVLIGRGGGGAGPSSSWVGAALPLGGFAFWVIAWLTGRGRTS